MRAENIVRILNKSLNVKLRLKKCQIYISYIKIPTQKVTIIDKSYFIVSDSMLNTANKDKSLHNFCWNWFQNIFKKWDILGIPVITLHSIAVI